MADDSRYEENQGRVEHEKVIDAAIEEWTRKHTAEDFQQWMRSQFLLVLYIALV